MLETVNMRNCATFDGEGATLGELSRVNVVYGGNGTGKTTISKIIAEPDLYPECELGWAGDRELRACVFNRHFRERCVAASDIPASTRWARAVPRRLRTSSASRDRTSRWKSSLRAKRRWKSRRARR